MKTGRFGTGFFPVKRLLISVLLLLTLGSFAGAISISAETVTVIAEGTCGENADYVLTSDGTLTISGSGKMTDYVLGDAHAVYAGYDNYGHPWLGQRSYICKVVVGEGITGIGTFAFFDCEKLTEVQLPSTLEEIGYYAFYDCAELETITLPTSLRTIKNFAFYGCTELTGMDTPSGVTNIDDRALDFVGDGAATDSTTQMRHQSIMNYLNSVYLREDCTLGFDVYNISEADKAVMQALVNDLTKDCATDQEKVDAIGHFVENTLLYQARDKNGYYGDYTEDVLRHLKGVCAGHNQFTSTLLKLAGFPTAIISGIKNSNQTLESFYSDSKHNHQWIMTYFDNSWHRIDTTTNYVIHNNVDTLSNYYVGFIVDGVFPVGENEDVFKLSMEHPCAMWHCNGSFAQRYQFNGLSSGVSGLYNNGAVLAKVSVLSRSLQLAETSALYEKKTAKETAVKYFSSRNNGLAIIGTNPSIDGSYYYWDVEGGIKTSREFAYTPHCDINTDYGSQFYLILGESLQITDIDLWGNTDGISMRVWDPSVVSVDMHGCITALKEGRTSVTLVLNGIDQVGFGVQVVSSAADIPTNAILQKYCTHEYVHKEYSSVVAATETNGGSYTCTEFCKYCGKQLESYSVTTAAIGEVSLEETEYTYDGKSHYPLVTVKDANQNALQMYQDYYLEYEETAATVGTHYVTVRFINGYTGTKILNYSIKATSYPGEWYSFDSTTGTLTISNITSIDNYSDISTRLWHSYREAINTIVLPSDLESIGENAFASCSNLTAIVLPETLHSIGTQAFQNCTSLETIEIPKAVTVLSEGLFSGCTKLKSVTFYDTVTTVKENAFEQCSALKWIFYDNLSPVYDQITVETGNDALSAAVLNSTKGSGEILASGRAGTNAKYVLTSDGRLTITGTGSAGCGGIDNSSVYGKVKEIYVNEGITSFGCGEGYSNSNVEKVYLPGTLTEVRSFAFSYHKALKEVCFQSGVAKIGSHAFEYCIELKNAALPDSITEIGDNAFEACSKLESIILPSSITKIGSCAFSNCKKLSSVNIPEGLEVIGEHAFLYTAITSVTLPDSLAVIGADAFSGGYIYLPSTVETLEAQSKGAFFTDEVNANWPTFTTIYSRVTREDFALIVSGNATYTVNYNLDGGSGSFPSSTRTYIINPDTIATDVPTRTDYIFGGWKVNGDDSVVLQSGGTITKEMWHENDCIVNLTAIWTPEPEDAIRETGSCGTNSSYVIRKNGLLTISGEGAITKYFKESSYASIIKNVVVEEGITTLGNNVFISCSSLESISLPNSLTQIGSGSLGGCPKLTTMTIPISAAINEYAFTGYNNEKSVNIDTVTFIPGTGVGCNYSSVSETMPWGYNGSNFKSIVLSEGITSIGSYMFNSYTLNENVSINIPSTVTSIGDYAFQSLKIKKLVIPASVKSLGTCWLAGCKNLTSIGPIGSGTAVEYGWTDEIPDEAFRGLTNVESVTIADGIKKIGELAFFSCSEIKELVIPDSVEAIETGAFTGCSKLEKITMPISAEVKSTSSFNYVLPNLNSMKYTAGTGYGTNYTIDTRCYQPWYKAGTTIIEFGEGIKSIGDYQFYHWYGQENVVLPNSLESIGHYAFAHCYLMDTIQMPLGAAVQNDSFLVNNLTQINFSAGNASAGMKLTWPPVTVSEDVIEALGASRPVSFNFSEETLSTANVDSSVRTEFDKMHSDGMIHGMYFDYTLNFNIDGTVLNVTELDSPINVNCELPTELKNSDANKNRSYYIIREHNGEYNYLPVSISDESDGAKFNFSSDKFSTFELVYIDAESGSAVKELKVSHAPNKTEYIEGQSFSAEGLQIIAINNDDSEAIIDTYDLGINRSLALGDTAITVLYGGKTVDIPITVKAKSLTSIAITTAPSKTEYVEGQLFEKTGMVVTAYYDNDTSAVVDDYTYTPDGELQTSDTKITVSYGGKSAEQIIKVLSVCGLTVDGTTYSLKVNTDLQKIKLLISYYSADGKYLSTTVKEMTVESGNVYTGILEKGNCKIFVLNLNYKPLTENWNGVID